jgi:hypothetical protein
MTDLTDQRMAQGCADAFKPMADAAKKVQANLHREKALELSHFLWSIGWSAPCDAQLTRIQEALPRLAEILGAAIEQDALRDQFAGQAMQAFVSSYAKGDFGGAADSDIAHDAYEMADAMLAARRV